MRILITGGAGFIGSHLAQRCVTDGHDVVVYDNFTSGKRENLAGFVEHLEVVDGDVRDAARLDGAAARCDLVFHEAAIVSVPYSIEHPQETHDINIQGTLNVLLAARNRDVRRLVFACSAAIYGDDPELPKRESMAASPISPYGVEKITGEQYLGVWSKLYGVETVSLRYFNVFGPRQDPLSAYSGVISIFVDRLLRDQTPTIFGDGRQCRDFVAVDNVVAANLLAATVPAANGRCYNVGTGKRTTLNELLAILGRLTGREASAHYAPARPGDIRDSVADITRARTELGYEPRVDVETGLGRLLAHVAAQPATG